MVSPPGMPRSASQTWRYAPFFHALLDAGVYPPCSAFEAWFVSAALSDDDFASIEAALPAAARAAGGLQPVQVAAGRSKRPCQGKPILQPFPSAALGRGSPVIHGNDEPDRRPGGWPAHTPAVRHEGERRPWLDC